MALKPIWDWWSVKQDAHVSSSDESDVSTFNPFSSQKVSDLPGILFLWYPNRTTLWFIPVPQPVTIPPLYKLKAEASRAIEISPCPRALKLVSSFCATYWNPLVLATPWNWVSLHCPLKNLLPQESHEDFQVVSLEI